MDLIQTVRALWERKVPITAEEMRAAIAPYHAVGVDVYAVVYKFFSWDGKHYVGRKV